MPIINTVCPHCEKSVEFNVTSVTRSRPCTHCGKPILLQVGSKGKHKALLVPSAENAESKEEQAAVADAAVPKVLEGDVRRRMLHDPEVQASMKQFRWGIAIVAGLVVITALLSHFDAWNKMSDFFANVGKHEVDSDVPDFKTANKVEKPKVVLPQGPTAGPSIPTLAEGAEADLAAALKAAAAFLGAKSADERFKIIRDQKMLDEKFHKYYTTHPDGPIPFLRVEPHATNPEGALTFAFVVVMPSGAKQQIIVGKARSGDYVVDWASFVHYGDMELSEFKTKRPVEPVFFRLLAVSESHFQGAFSDAKSLLCVKLIDPRSSEDPPLYGYVDRMSTLGRSVDFVLRKSLGQAVPIMATLKYPDSAQSDNQVWLTELVGEGWVARGK